MRKAAAVAASVTADIEKPAIVFPSKFGRDRLKSWVRNGDAKARAVRPKISPAARHSIIARRNLLMASSPRRAA